MYSVDLHRDLKLKAIAVSWNAPPGGTRRGAFELIEEIFFSIGKDRYLDHWWLNGQYIS